MTDLATTVLDSADRLIAEHGIAAVADAMLTSAVALLVGDLGSAGAAEVVRAVLDDLDRRPNFYVREYYRQ